MTREDAIEILKKYSKAVHMIIQELSERTGHWIQDETDNSIECDKCGCVMWANDLLYGDAYYCPNCGCKMMEVKHE